MKKALVFAALLLGVSFANAQGQIRLFFSTTGISGDLRYSTTLTNFLPQFQTADEIVEHVWPLPPMLDLFVWGQFVGVPDHARIIGMQLTLAGTTAAYDHSKSVIYRQRYFDTDNGIEYKRWDGALPVYVHNGVMAAVTARGIRNRPPTFTGNDYDLYDKSTRTFLLGVVHVPAPRCCDQVTVSLNPQLGIKVKNAQGVDLNPQPTVIPATVWFDIPEPASLLLLGLAGLAIRRR